MPLKAEIQELNADDLLTTVFAELGFSARAAGVRLVLDTPQAGVRVLAARDPLIEVLLALTAAAIETHAPGGVVTVASRPRGAREVVVEIAAVRGGSPDTYRLILPAAPGDFAGSGKTGRVPVAAVPLRVEVLDDEGRVVREASGWALGPRDPARTGPRGGPAYRPAADWLARG